MAPTPLIGVLLAVGAAVIAYRIGHANGFAAGQAAGFDEGKQAGSRDMAKRAFAVGFDRGKRSAGSAAESDSPAATSTHPGVLAMMLLIFGLGLFWFMHAKPLDPTRDPKGMDTVPQVNRSAPP